MQQLKFDFNNMFDFNVGQEHGITLKELEDYLPAAQECIAHFEKLISNKTDRINLNLEWTMLPFQDKQAVKRIQSLGNKISKSYENALFLGIGGSYLGLKAAQDALCSPYYNEFAGLRKGRAKIYFDGNNIDPVTLKTLLSNLNPKKTFVVVISKSGETTETKAAFELARNWLKKAAGAKYGRQILAITDPESGTLRKIVNEEQKKDKLSFMNLPLLKGVGGRFSEFNMGLLHMAIAGISIEKVLAGAERMYKLCTEKNVYDNPAYLYAILQMLSSRNKGKSISIVMPFSEELKSTAEWYVQLLAESLGKKYARKIIENPDGTEKWVNDTSKTVNTGRTPIPSRGTNDLHSIQQNNVEGMTNKTVTFIRIEKYPQDLTVPDTKDFIAGKKYSRLIQLAQEATEWALVRQQRPNCTIILPELNANTWGQLLFFFEMTTAVEGELLGINAFDQPGVEGYKNYIYHKLNKPGLGQEIAKEITNNPLVKKPEFVL